MTGTRKSQGHRLCHLELNISKNGNYYCIHLLLLLLCISNIPFCLPFGSNSSNSVGSLSSGVGTLSKGVGSLSLLHGLNVHTYK